MNRRAFLGAVAAAMAFGPTSLMANPDAMTGDDPMAAAVYLSKLETITHIPALYQLYEFLHPDAAELVPRATVIGWYREDFQPRSPKPAVATGLTWLDEWTWPVNDVSYSDVAEVRYTQQFADGSTETDVVRLMKHNGVWRWFFGRSREWVDEQNDRFDLRLHTPQEGDAPFGLGALENLNPAILDQLPTYHFDIASRTHYTLTESEEISSTSPWLLPGRQLDYRAHAPTSPIGLAYIEHGTIMAPETEPENLDSIALREQNAPPVEFLGWNTEPAHGPAWLHVRHDAVDVIGPSYTLYLVSVATYMRVTTLSEEVMEVICEALAEN